MKYCFYFQEYVIVSGIAALYTLSYFFLTKVLKVREAAKKILLLMAGPLREGVKAGH